MAMEITGGSSLGVSLRGGCVVGGGMYPNQSRTLVLALATFAAMFPCARAAQNERASRVVCKKEGISK